MKKSNAKTKMKHEKMGNTNNNNNSNNTSLNNAVKKKRKKHQKKKMAPKYIDIDSNNNSDSEGLVEIKCHSCHKVTLLSPSDLKPDSPGKDNINEAFVNDSTVAININKNSFNNNTNNLHNDDANNKGSSEKNNSTKEFSIQPLSCYHMLCTDCIAEQRTSTLRVQVENLLALLVRFSPNFITSLVILVTKTFLDVFILFCLTVASFMVRDPLAVLFSIDLFCFFSLPCPICEKRVAVVSDYNESFKSGSLHPDHPSTLLNSFDDHHHAHDDVLDEYPHDQDSNETTLSLNLPGSFLASSGVRLFMSDNQSSINSDVTNSKNPKLCVSPTNNKLSFANLNVLNGQNNHSIDEDQSDWSLDSGFELQKRTYCVQCRKWFIDSDFQDSEYEDEEEDENDHYYDFVEDRGDGRLSNLRSFNKGVCVQSNHQQISLRQVLKSLENLECRRNELDLHASLTIEEIKTHTSSLIALIQSRSDSIIDNVRRQANAELSASSKKKHDLIEFIHGSPLSFNNEDLLKEDQLELPLKFQIEYGLDEKEIEDQLFKCKVTGPNCSPVSSASCLLSTNNDGNLGSTTAKTTENGSLHPPSLLKRQSTTSQQPTTTTTEVIMPKKKVQFEHDASYDLLQAIKKGDLDLVSHHPMVNDLSPLICRSWLHISAQHGQIAICEYLIENGADVNARDESRRTPLHYAVKSETNSLQIAKLLIKKGANVSARDENSKTPLHLAILNSQSNDFNRLVEYLISSGSNVNDIDVNGETVLIKAVENNHLHLVKVLIRHGANGELKNVDGLSALDFAAEQQQFQDHHHQNALKDQTNNSLGIRNKNNAKRPPTRLNPPNFYSSWRNSNEDNAKNNSSFHHHSNTSSNSSSKMGSGRSIRPSSPSLSSSLTSLDGNDNILSVLKQHVQQKNHTKFVCA